METVLADGQSTLPHYLTPFIGRRQEVADIRHLLTGRRLLTLTGPGGSGKTRLALAVAAELVEQFPDGISLVELADLGQPDLAAQRIAKTLGLREQPDVAWETLLANWLRPKRFLLLLDNCEHLLDACAVLADALLRACPHLTILATSREALGIMGETIWPTPPLSLPPAETGHSAETLLTYDAISLFVERAQAAVPGFALTATNAPAVVALCRQLDGLPLALELAAARLRSLAVSQILRRLEHSLSLLAHSNRTAVLRQQTMYAAIDWSYQLLDSSEAVLFRRLAVFAGGFTLAAAEVVCGNHYSVGKLHPEHRPLNTDFLDLLTSLIDKSLVVVVAREPEARYRLLEPVRRFAWEKLEAGGELDNLRQRHADYYLGLAETAEPFLRHANRPEWLERLEAEHDNLRNALHWLQESNQVALAMRLSAALIWFWYFAGLISDAAQQFRRYLVTAVQTANTDYDVQGRLAWGIGATAWIAGDYAAAQAALEQSRQLAQTANDRRTLAYALTLLGLVNQLLGDDQESLALAQASITLFQETGDRWGEALALYWLGDTLRLRREHAAALPYYEQSQVQFRQLGDPWGVALSLQGLGSVAYRQGEVAAARQWLAEGLTLRRLSGDRWLLAQTLSTLATVLAAQGETAVAQDQFKEAITLYQDVGDTYGAMYGLFRLGQLCQTAGEPGLARDHFHDCLALALATGHQKRIEMCQAALAELEAVHTSQTTSAPILEIFAFGPGEIFQNGAPIAWPYSRVRELFFYLLDQGPRRKGQIGLDLWPEASPAKLRRHLHDALYHARKALGEPAWIVYEHGRYAFNAALPHQYDVAAFMAHLEPANSTPEERIRQLQQAVALYRADFLDEFDTDWCRLRREVLRRLFLAALLELGELFYRHGRYATAADTYRQAIAHDNLLEEAHRELMRCYIALGQPAKAVQQYHALVQLLADELGMAPAPETAALITQ